MKSSALPKYLKRGWAGREQKANEGSGAFETTWKKRSEDGIVGSH